MSALKTVSLASIACGFLLCAIPADAGQGCCCGTAVVSSPNQVVVPPVPVSSAPAPTVQRYSRAYQYGSSGVNSYFGPSGYRVSNRGWSGGLGHDFDQARRHIRGW